MRTMTLKPKFKPLGECKMCLTHVAVSLLNSAASSDTYNADFLVDTGAMYTMAPASELKKIGIEPDGKDLFELANGELIEFEYGVAKLKFMNEIIGTRILFGPDRSEPIL